MKYPIFNPIAYWLLALLDTVLELFFAPFIKKTKTSDTPKRILICHTAHLGDVILTTALLPVLRQAFPEAHLGMLVGSWSLEILKGHKMIQNIHCIDHWKVNRGQKFWFQKVFYYLRQRRTLIKELRHASYDLALDCSPFFPNMSYVLWRAKITVRIGFTSAGFSTFLTHPKPFAFTNQSMISTFFSLLEDFKIKQDCHLLRPSLVLDTSLPKQDFIVVHIGSGNCKKNWPTNQWRKLVKRLIAEGETLYFTGKGELENQEICHVMHGLPRTYNLCNKQTWSAFTQTIQQAALLIGVDTCSGHLAAAAGTPAVLLYTGIHYPKTWAPCGKNIIVLTLPIPCSPCFKGCKAMTCMQGIPEEKVYQAVRSFKPVT